MEPSLVHQDSESPASRPASCSSPHQVSYQPPRGGIRITLGRGSSSPSFTVESAGGAGQRFPTAVPREHRKSLPGTIPVPPLLLLLLLPLLPPLLLLVITGAGVGGMFVYVCLVGFLFLCMQAFGSCLRLSLWVGENPRLPEEKIIGATSRKAGDEHSGRVWVAEERV